MDHRLLLLSPILWHVLFYFVITMRSGCSNFNVAFYMKEISVADIHSFELRMKSEYDVFSTLKSDSGRVRKMAIYWVNIRVLDQVVAKSSS